MASRHVEPTSLFFDRGQDSAPARRVIVDGMGIHERMPPGMIRHGGVGMGYPYLLVLFHTPTQMLLADGKTVPSERRLVLWGENSFHCYGNASAAWDHSWLRVVGPWARGAFRRSGFPLDVPLPCSSHDAVVKRLAAIHDELTRGREQDSPMLEALLDVLWIEIGRCCVSSTPVPDERIAQARQAIESDFTRPFSLRDAASRACLSSAHFCQLFGREVGVSPGEYVIRLRMHRARQLLSDPTIPVSRVAQLVGYDDAYYFSRLFRRRHGSSPSAFRATAR